MALALLDFQDAVMSIGAGSVTLASVAAGDTLVACVRWNNDTKSIASITCTAESNLTLLGARQTGGPDAGGSQWAILSNVTTGGSKTVTVTMADAPTGTAGGISVWRWSGALTTGANDVIAGASALSGSPTVSLTTTVANAAIMAVTSTKNTPTAGTGYTQSTLADTFWFDEGEYNASVGAAGSKTVDFSSSTTEWVINALAIKPAGGGSSVAPRAAGHFRRLRA